MFRTFCCLTVLLSAGCSHWVPTFYSIDIRQGNYLDKEMVDQLKPGMSKRQVQFLLGAPPIADPFHQNRWDYLYSFRPEGGKETIHRRVTVYFSGDTLSRIEDNEDKWDESKNG